MLWCATTCWYELMMCELLWFVIMNCNRYWPPTSPLLAFVVVANCCLVIYSPPSPIPPLHVYISKLEVFELGLNSKLLFLGGNKFHEVFHGFFSIVILTSFMNISHVINVLCFSFHFFHSFILFHFLSMFCIYIFLKVLFIQEFKFWMKLFFECMVCHMTYNI